MIIFTCKKYDFLIEKSLPSLSAPPPKNQGGVSFTEDLSEFRQIYLRIQVFVGLVMLENNTLVPYSSKLSTVELTLIY